MNLLCCILGHEFLPTLIVDHYKDGKLQNVYMVCRRCCHVHKAIIIKYGENDAV